MNLIAKQEGIQPRQHNKWTQFFDAPGTHTFAITQLHSTFIRPDDDVSCHPECLLICIVPCLDVLSMANCMGYRMDCVCCVK